MRAVFALLLASCAAWGQMRVVARPGKSSLVDFRIVFLTGAAYDPPDKPGLANLTAQLLSDGSTRELSHKQLVEAMFPMAASVESQVDKEMIVFHGSTDGQKVELVREAEVIFAAGPAGRQLLSSEQLKHAKKLLVVTDVNAVPPAGVEGVGVNDDAKPVPGTKAVGIGALAVGNIKYKTEYGLFEDMIKAEKPVYLDFRAAYDLAQKLAG